MAFGALSYRKRLIAVSRLPEFHSRPFALVKRHCTGFSFCMCSAEAHSYMLMFFSSESLL